MITMYNASVNSPIARLVGAIDNVQTSITLDDASLLPPFPNLLTISSGNIEDDETCIYTNVVGNVVTVQRGFESAAKGWADNSYVSRVFSAYDHNTFKTNISYLYDLMGKTQDPTGFTNPEGITVTYNSISRTVTLTGDVEFYYNGEVVSALVSGWESTAHPASPTAGQFLKYTSGGGFVWSTTPWEFYEGHIAYIMFLPDTTFITGVREVHGLMPWQVHKEFHEKVGTYLISGGDFAGYVLDSTTATDRRPTIAETTIADEDLTSVLSADATQNSYSHLYLSGTDTLNFAVDQAEFLQLNGGIPTYNELSGTWGQTDLVDGEFTSIWMFCIPATSDTASQKYRYVFMQGQSVSTDINTEKALHKDSLNLTPLGALATEFVFATQIIVKREGATWSIKDIHALGGSREGTFNVASISANQVTFDNLVSNLVATNVKDAIDELDNRTDKLEYANTKSQDPTGFTNPAGITITYNSVSRTVTLTGDVELLWNGDVVSGITSGWESPVHAVGPTTGLFLKYTQASGFEWSTTPWEFYEAQIAYLLFLPDTSFVTGIREVHGLMDWETHRELHNKIGTYRQSGGALSNYVINSVTATDRRPTIAETVLFDEDLESTLAQDLTQNSYTHLYLSSTNTLNFVTDQAEILQLTNGRPLYNEWTGAVWQNTEIPNGDYMSIWQIAIPTTADTTSQKHRFVFMMGQEFHGKIADERSVKASQLDLSALASLSTEYTFINQIIVERNGNDWRIQDVISLDGDRQNVLGASTTYSASQISYNNLISNLNSEDVKLAIDEVTVETEITPVTTDYTLAYTDKYKVVVMNKTGDATLTIPLNATVAFPVGTILSIYNISTNDVYIAGAVGVTVRNNLRLRQYQSMILRKRATDEWVTDKQSLWLDPVDTFSSITTVYPNPVTGNKVITEDNLSVYAYSGTAWFKLNRGEISRFSEFAITANQSIPTNGALMAWTSVVSDPHNFQSGVNTRFIVPSGINYVRLTCTLYTETWGKDLNHYLEFRKNGTSIGRTSMRTRFLDYYLSGTSKVISVTTNDYLEVFAYNGGAANNVLVADTFCQVEVLV